MKNCRVFFEDDTCKTVMKLRDDDDAETWKLLLKPILKESVIDSTCYTDIMFDEEHDENEYIKQWQEWTDRWHDKLTCFIPEEFHEDCLYYPLKRIETL